jgi:glycosyltransferase involved in cell wall biosynthesis
MQSWLKDLVEAKALEIELAAAQTQLAAEQAATAATQAHLSALHATYVELVSRFHTVEASYLTLHASQEALQGSLAWALARRMAQLRLRLAPDGSHRARWLQHCARLLRLCKRTVARLVGRRHHELVEASPVEAVPPCSEPLAACKDADISPPEADGCTHCLAEALVEEVPGPDRSGPARAPSTRKFRVAFLGSGGQDLHTMRYRAHHVMEALALFGLESTYVAEEELPDRLSTLLAHDLIVLVRRQYNEAIAALLDAARRLHVPVVFDIDDYLFDHWVLPYVEALSPLSLPYMDKLSRCLDACDYFTGSTTRLVEQAAARNKDTFLIHNSLGAEQIQLSLDALQERTARGQDGIVRIGYFSGSRTHQADFRVVYPALLRLLSEEPNVHLVVAGDLELACFPGLAAFADRVMRLPFSDWRRLPANIALVDINLIPLVLTPFNDGKSNLKYYEAGVLKIPSIASPTEIHRESIVHGHNGLLASTPEEWYDGLKSLVNDPVRRAGMGQNAYEHVLRSYSPPVTAGEAVTAYREVLRLHRARAGLADDALSIVLLLPDLDGSSPLDTFVRRANELVEAGHAVTAYVPEDTPAASAQALRQLLAERAGEPRFVVQRGGDLPCGDVLMATDGKGVRLAREQAGRAHVTVFLALDAGGPTAGVDSSGLPVVVGTGAELEAELRQWVRQSPLDYPLPAPAPRADAVPFREASCFAGAGGLRARAS